MTKYVKKPVVVEAMQLPLPYPEGVDPSIDAYARNVQANNVYQWVERNTSGSFDPRSPEIPEIPASGVSIDPATGFLLIATLEGVMQAKPGDWIIRGTEGEFYPCKPEPFAATFEAVEDTPEQPKQKGPKTTRLAVIEVDHPGYRVMSAEVAMPLGDPVPSLDNVAIQLHELANDLIMAIRKAGPK